MAEQNKGFFIPTTQSWDIGEVKETDVNSPKFKELIVRLYQNINQMAQSVNGKSSGFFYTQEFASGDQYFPSTSLSSSSSTFIAPRSVFRKVVNFGALPNTNTTSVAHGITIASTFSVTRIYGAATNSAGTSWIPIPYASPTASNNIELKADNTNVIIITGSDRTSYTKCYVVLEYIKN